MASKFVLNFSSTTGVVFVVSVITLILSCQVKTSLAEAEEPSSQNRNMMPNIFMGSHATGAEGTQNLENQIVGSIPLIPTLKLGALSTLILPGLHFTLTLLTIFFALVGIASFICTGYDCRSILRSDDISGFSQSFLPKNRHPMGHHNRPWEAAPSIFQSLDNTYSRYKEHQRTEK